MRCARFPNRLQRAPRPVCAIRRCLPALPLRVMVPLRRCVKLEVLEARQNQLATLPSGIGACRMLIELDLAQNQIVMLAPELAGCAKLTILDISGNSVTAPAIPPTLLKATSLAVRAIIFYAASWVAEGGMQVTVGASCVYYSDCTARAARSTRESWRR